VIFYTVAGISASFLSVFIISTYNIGFGMFQKLNSNICTMTMKFNSMKFLVSLFALPLVLLVFIAVGYFAYQSVRGIREVRL
jgi:hypothetical protein